MTSYTITIGTGSGDLAGYYGFYPTLGDPFPPGFGAIGPGGSGVLAFVWAADGSFVAISAPSLPVGSEVQWLGQTYVLDDGEGSATYNGPGLGGTYPTSGTTDFDLAAGVATITATGEIEIAWQITGTTIPPFEATGDVVIANPVAQGGNLPPVTATGELVFGNPVASARGWAITGTRRVAVLRTGPGTWTVPDDWNPGDNRITTIGAAGNGAAGPDLFSGGASGGTSAYMRSTNLSLTPGANYGYDVGPGKHARFGGTSLADCIIGSEKGGNASGITAGTAGLVANSRGDTGVDGTAGTAGGAVGIILNPGAAPGAPGPGGAGAPGQKLLDGAAGGQGGGGAGGRGGGAATDGYPGNDYGDGIGSGGGGGTGSAASAVRGGLFGGAGPGSPWGWPAGIGDGGAIIISYAPVILAAGDSVISPPVAEAFVPSRIATAAGNVVLGFPIVQGTAGIAPVTAVGDVAIPFPIIVGRQGNARRRAARIIIT